MRRSFSAPAHQISLDQSRLVAAVAVLRIIVIAPRRVVIVVIRAVGRLGDVDLNAGDVAADVGPALPGEIDLLLAAVAIAAAVAAAVGDAVHRQATVRTRFDPADAEHPSAAAGITIVAVAAVAAVATA